MSIPSAKLSMVPSAGNVPKEPFSTKIKSVSWLTQDASLSIKMTAHVPAATQATVSSTKPASRTSKPTLPIPSAKHF